MPRLLVERQGDAPLHARRGLGLEVKKAADLQDARCLDDGRFQSDVSFRHGSSFQLSSALQVSPSVLNRWRSATCSASSRHSTRIRYCSRRVSASATEGGFGSSASFFQKSLRTWASASV